MSFREGGGLNKLALISLFFLYAVPPGTCGADCSVFPQQGCCADSEAALKVAEREEKAEKEQQRASLCAFLFPLEV